MTETATPAVPETKKKPKGSFVITMIPILAFLAMGAAVLSVFVFELNQLDPYELYGTLQASWVPIALLVATVALAIVSIWRKDLPYAYLAAAPLVVFGTGGRLYPEDFAGIFVFAASVFLFVEYLSAQNRFINIVQSTQTLDAKESTPVKRFLMRYLLGSVALILLYCAMLFGFAKYAIPAISAGISTRMGQGLEIETAWGITIFTFLFLALPILGRMIYDSILEYRVKRARLAAEAAAQASLPAPAAAPKEAST